MRRTILCLLVTTAITGCGDDGGPAPIPPRVIPGGGIGDGPIDGVANLYVIDDATRKPVHGANVRIGDVSGTTDVDGLFVAEGLTGAQTVVVTAGTYRPEMWVGANGTNLTLNMQPASDPVVAKANLSGTIGLTSIVLPAGHMITASVNYSQTDDVGDLGNNIETPNGANVCFTGVQNNQPCTFTVASRTGHVGLIAAIYDRDLKGTPANPADDTQTLIGWATRTGITVTGGVDQSGQDLTLVSGGNLGTVTIDFGTTPAGLSSVAAVVGIKLPIEGVFQLPVLVTPTSASVLAPKPAAFGATSYQLVGLANNGSDPATTESIVIRRALAGTSLAAGTWLVPPQTASLTRTGASWSAVDATSVYSVEYGQGSAHLLNVTVFDGSTQITVPDLVTLPTGAIQGKVSAIGATGLDVNEFALDDDRTKLDRVADQVIHLN